eukprot:7226153-Lingulodinium_polyedra.AAC.1
MDEAVEVHVNWVACISQGPKAIAFASDVRLRPARALGDRVPQCRCPAMSAVGAKLLAWCD